MPLFDRDDDKLRKEHLKNLEDKRLRMAEEMQRIGFAPDRMIICSTEDGRYSAIARHNGKYAVIVSPAFGSDEEFIVEFFDRLQWEKEDIFQKGEGLNGIMGFGKKGAKGFIIHITLSDGSDAPLNVIAGRTSIIETMKLRKNPLLSTKRRRGDANVFWDLLPLDPKNLKGIEERLMDYYLAD